MLIEDSVLIEFAIGELRTLISECKIATALFNEEPTEPTGLIDVIKGIADQQRSMREYEKQMEYLNGKFEAYVAMLKKLGVDTEKINKL